MTKPDLILLALDDPAVWPLFDRALQHAGFDVALAQDSRSLDKALLGSTPSLVVINETLDGESGLSISNALLDRFPTLPILLLTSNGNPRVYEQALNQGLYGCLVPPLTSEMLIEKIRRSLARAVRTGDWVRREVKRTTSSLEERVDALERLLKLGRDVTSLLELSQVLQNVVSDAVTLTRAEEGCLLLLSEDGRELHNRAGRIFERVPSGWESLPVEGSMAGRVVESGAPLVLNESNLKHVDTAFFVKALVYVPLRLQAGVIGVLGVFNSQRNQAFTEQHTRLLSVLADYAAIAIENARLYTVSETERQKFAAVFANIDSGVVLLDGRSRILYVNQSVRQAFKLGDQDLEGQFLLDAIQHPDVNSLYEHVRQNTLKYHEINLDDGQTLNAQYTLIPGVGSAITMQDITHLKELDRLKNDFVHTVSHDLRSPLTAVLGYTELLERVGPLNDQQRDFVKHIQSGVINITSLVNDLLDLSRIEAGFDVRKEDVQLEEIVKQSLENLRGMSASKRIHLTASLPDQAPLLRGSRIRLRQMVDNLASNAIKYTPEGGQVSVRLSAEEGLVILQVVDNGPGIPKSEQPHIFDKFYRASNVPSGTPGTGLGLAIVKSIVENHQGRIWVSSTLGEGSTFTVVLPSAPAAPEKP
ncbi:MAG: ATP-binding protein [Chloroflexota bacterium]